MVRSEFKVICTECQHEHHVTAQTLERLDNGGMIRCPKCLTLLSPNKPAKKNLKLVTLALLLFVGIVTIALLSFLNLTLETEFPTFLVALSFVLAMGIVAVTMKSNSMINSTKNSLFF